MTQRGIWFVCGGLKGRAEWSLDRVEKDKRDKFSPPEKWVCSVCFQEQILENKTNYIPSSQTNTPSRHSYFWREHLPNRFWCLCPALLNDLFFNLCSVPGFVIFYSFAAAHRNRRTALEPKFVPLYKSWLFNQTVALQSLSLWMLSTALL